MTSYPLMNAGEEFAQLFSTIQSVCQKLDVEVCVPRRASRMTHRNNIPSETPEDFYRAAVYIPFVDSFLLQLKERLTDHKTSLMNQQKLMNRTFGICTSCMQMCCIAVNYQPLVSYVYGTVVFVSQLQRMRERRLQLATRLHFL